MSFILSLADEYDTSALINIRKPTFFQKLFVRVSVPFYLPVLLWRFIKTTFKTHPLHDGKRNLSGVRLVESCKDFALADIKECSKKLHVTINDLMTSCLGSTVKQYIELKGDTTTKYINIGIPANIRFEHYESPEKVKLENKIAALPLCLPLKNDI